jgi:hypothetical protein
MQNLPALISVAVHMTSRRSMHPAKLRCVLVFMLALVASVPALAAGKRRSVRHPSPGTRFVVTISGTVLDNVTSQPVRNAIVSAGDFTGVTDSEGKYRLRNVVAFNAVDVKAERSGYVTGTHRLKINEAPEIAFRLTPTQTVTVRRTDGSTATLDVESVRFGHSGTFSGYVPSIEYCKADGTRVPMDFSQMSRITGPGVLATTGPCCDDQVAKMPLTLKNAQTLDMFFIESCGNRYKIDFSGREHVSGEYQYILITDIAEIVFP